MRKLSISREEFKAAFREVISSEFAHIPTDESSIDFTFSEKFNKKMEKLIKSQRKSYYIFINTVGKRVAILFVAIITLFTASMSVKAIREPVINFIIEVYESFSKYFFEGETAEKIEKVYSITKLPVGFKQTQVVENDAGRNVTFESSEGNIIVFTQSATQNAELNIDNQKVSQAIKQVEDKEIHIYYFESDTYMFWTDQGYCFQIISYGNIETDTLIEMIESIE